MTEREALLRDLRDLHKQATQERSHYYVGSVIERCIAHLSKPSSPIVVDIGEALKVLQANPETGQALMAALPKDQPLDESQIALHFVPAWSHWCIRHGAFECYRTDPADIAALVQDFVVRYRARLRTAP